MNNLNLLVDLLDGYQGVKFWVMGPLPEFYPTHHLLLG